MKTPRVRLFPIERQCVGFGVAQSRVQATQRSARFSDQRFGERNLTAVVRAQQKKPQHFSVVLLQRIANRHHVAERLRHFFVAYS